MRPLTLSAAFLSAAILSGCGGEERLYNVSGTVTWGGQPIPKGKLMFDPLGPGLQGYATIVNGKYDTAEPLNGKGVRPGKYSVRLNAFDGVTGIEAPFGNGLFPEFTTTHEFPAADSTYDLDVPKAGKKK